MATIPEIRRLNKFSNLLEEIKLAVDGVANWVVDKHVSNTELYIHTTSAFDGAIAYFSMMIENYDTNHDVLRVYPNTGFDTGLAVNAQPGVPHNGTNIGEFNVYTGTGGNFRIGAIILNDNTLLVTTILPAIRGDWSSDYIYMGNVKKHTAYTGGQFIRGNTRISPTPEAFLNTDAGDCNGWCSYGDDGAFNSDPTSEFKMNHINYEALDYSYSHINSTFVFGTYDLYVAYDSGFAPIGVVENLYSLTNSNSELPVYGEIRLNGNIYFTVPTSTKTSDAVALQIGTY